MRFNTRDRTPKIKTNKTMKIMLAIGFGMPTALLVFIAIVCSLYISSVMPAVLILTPVVMLAMLIAVTQKDMDKAFVEIVDDVITVTDYYFGIKKCKIFQLHDIATAEILSGTSMRVCGYRYSNAGCSYIVFRNCEGKYMFKVLCVPETKRFFESFIA